MSTRSTTPKLHISPPLEAGPSLLESRQLPEVLNEALEYVSHRLARKKLHISLIVVRQEPTTQSTLNQPSFPSSPPAIPHSPISRTQTHSPFSDISSALSAQSHLSTSSNASLSRTKWASLPATPRDRLCAPLSPRDTITHYTTLSPTSAPITAIPNTEPLLQNPYGITLLHATTLSPKASKILRHIISRAEKKFSIGSGWLPTSSLASLPPSSPLSPTTSSISPTSPTNPGSDKATNTIICRSLTQNTVLFSSEGLTLLALDTLYKFKSQLSHYSLTLSPRDLEPAVDELHRLVLSRRGRKLTKSELTGTYEWVTVNDRAIGDVDAAYKSTYGGVQRSSGIDMNDTQKTERKGCGFEVKRLKLSLDTSCGDLASGMGGFGKMEKEVEEKLTPVDVGESAKGKDCGLGWESPESATPQLSSMGMGMGKGQGTGMIMMGGGCREDIPSHSKAPVTPLDGRDISPITGREWALLIGGSGCEIITC